MGLEAPARVQVELGFDRSVSPWARDRYFAFLSQLELMLGPLEYFDSNGPVAPAVAAMLARGTTDRLVHYAQSLSSEDGVVFANWAGAHSVGVSCSDQRLRRHHDVEIQFTPSIDAIFEEDLNSPRKRSDLIAAIQHQVQITDIFIVATDLVKEDLVRFFGVHPDHALIAPPPFYAADAAARDSVVAIECTCTVLVDGLTSNSKKLAMASQKPAKSAFPGAVSVATWHMGCGEADDTMFKQDFDIARPMVHSERATCLRSAELIVLVGERGSTNDVMREAMCGRGVIVAPYLSGYEARRSNPSTRIVRYRPGDAQEIEDAVASAAALPRSAGIDETSSCWSACENEIFAKNLNRALRTLK